MSQLSIKVVADLRKVEAELFDFLADKMGGRGVMAVIVGSFIL